MSEPTADSQQGQPQQGQVQQGQVQQGQAHGGGPEPAPEGGNLKFDTIFRDQPPGNSKEMRSGRGDVTTKRPRKD